VKKKKKVGKSPNPNELYWRNSLRNKRKKGEKMDRRKIKKKKEKEMKRKLKRRKRKTRSNQNRKLIVKQQLRQ